MRTRRPITAAEEHPVTSAAGEGLGAGARIYVFALLAFFGFGCYAFWAEQRFVPAAALVSNWFALSLPLALSLFAVVFLVDGLRVWKLPFVKRVLVLGVNLLVFLGVAYLIAVISAPAVWTRAFGRPADVELTVSAKYFERGRSGLPNCHAIRVEEMGAGRWRRFCVDKPLWHAVSNGDHLVVHGRKSPLGVHANAFSALTHSPCPRSSAVRVYVSADGSIRLDGKGVSLDELATAFSRLADPVVLVCYSRDAPSGDGPPVADEVIRRIAAYRLNVSFYSDSSFEQQVILR